MLHAHVPENIRNFAKHLFATFLGLLMALGLEQWNEHRREAHAAHAFLERIQEDLDLNAAYCRNMALTFKACKEFDERVGGQIKAVLEARKRGAKAPLIVKDGNCRDDMRFYTSAWDAAKASGVLQHLPPRLVQDLSRSFEDLRRIEALDAGWLNTETMTAVSAHFHEDWNALDTRDLEAVLAGVTFLRGMCANWEAVCRNRIPEIEKTRLEVEKALRA
jgi:hypothetical protein